MPVVENWILQSLTPFKERSKVSFFLIDDDEESVPRLQGVELSVLSELGAVPGAGASTDT